MTRPVGEDEVLESIRGIVGNGIEAFGLRDDAACWSCPAGGPLLASVDSVVEGVHVDLSLCSPGDVGWKALMGALSDLAAMGAAPLGALVALCVPGGSGEGELALGVMEGVAEASAAAGLPRHRGRRVGGGRAGGRGDRAGHGRSGRRSAGRPVRGAARRRGARHRPVRRVGGGAAGLAGRRPAWTGGRRLPAARGAPAGGRSWPASPGPTP